MLLINSWVNGKRVEIRIHLQTNVHENNTFQNTQYIVYAAFRGNFQSLCAYRRTEADWKLAELTNSVIRERNKNKRVHACESKNNKICQQKCVKQEIKTEDEKAQILLFGKSNKISILQD